MAKGAISSTHVSKSRKRKGVHSKSKNSRIKSSKSYKKKYRGQGK